MIRLRIVHVFLISWVVMDALLCSHYMMALVGLAIRHSTYHKKIYFQTFPR